MRSQRIAYRIDQLEFNIDSRNSRLHCMSTLRSSPTRLNTHERRPPQTEGKPSKDISEEGNTEDTGFDDGESEVTGDGIEIFDAVADGSHDAEDDP